jgi:hypothetical protein
LKTIQCGLLLLQLFLIIILSAIRAGQIQLVLAFLTSSILGNLFMVLVFASMALGSPITVDQSAGADRLTADPII